MHDDAGAPVATEQLTAQILEAGQNTLVFDPDLEDQAISNSPEWQVYHSLLANLGIEDGALDGYQGFLKRYPKSPLASVARTRIRCISREIRGLKGRKGVPLPIYKGGSSVSAANQPDKSLEVKPDRPASPSVR